MRPRYHFTPQKNWINDPNGLVVDGGEVHLFHQYNPFGDQWGRISWGHAVSTDFLHWQELPHDDSRGVILGAVRAMRFAAGRVWVPTL